MSFSYITVIENIILLVLENLLCLPFFYGNPC